MLRGAYVYVIFDLDGVPRYVGKGNGNRWQRDKERGKHNRHFLSIATNAQKNGRELPRVKIRENLNDADALEIEIALIAAIGRGRNGPLVNMTDGGEGIINPSVETRAKISASTKKRMSNPDARARLSVTSKEWHANPKIRSINRDRMLALRADPATGPLLKTPRSGATVSDDTRARIGLKAKQRMSDPKNREAISNALRGQSQSAETKKKRGASLAAYWDNRRKLGLPMVRPAEDEEQRRRAIQVSMLSFWHNKRGAKCSSS